VVSVDRGEPLARVQVAVLVEAQREVVAAAITTKDGSFVIQGLAPGHYMLRLNAVGYRLITVKFSLAVDEAAKEFDVTLVPDNFRRTERVEVKGDIFQGPDSPAVTELNLTSSEIRETSTVLADDPFRAIQTLPGVSASGNNDFFAQFSVMGTPFDDVSTYIDGILVPQPFHGEPGFNQGATLSLLTSETVEDVKLLPVAYPQKYGDAVGAALDIQTRDGSRTPPVFRLSIGMADTEVLAEGQLGHSRRGSWLASGRKSYLGYLLRNRLNETFTDVSFYDGDVKLIYDLRPNQTVSFYGLGGHTVADLVHPPQALQPGEFKRGINDLTLLRGGWRWTVNPRLLLDTHSAYLRAPFTTYDLNNTVINNTHYQDGLGVAAWYGHGAKNMSSKRDGPRATGAGLSGPAQAALRPLDGGTMGTCSRPRGFSAIGCTWSGACDLTRPANLISTPSHRSCQRRCRLPVRQHCSSELDATTSSVFPLTRDSLFLGVEYVCLPRKVCRLPTISPPGWSAASGRVRAFELHFSIGRTRAKLPAMVVVRSFRRSISRV
jgi:hypothetical protein